ICLLNQLSEIISSHFAWLAPFVERFEHFFEANDVPDASVIGATTYSLLLSLLALDKPGSKPYKDVVDTLDGHFFPNPIIAKRFRFHKCNQEEGETIAQYVAILKKSSKHCDFGAHLQDALHDICSKHRTNEDSEPCVSDKLATVRSVRYTYQPRNTPANTKPISKTDLQTTRQTEHLNHWVKSLNCCVTECCLKTGAQ
uniref:Retrotransposon gag domain-containing protein n=1 Tax=Astyanax mexicanus TaxID=7994 RepID=A0A3B1JB34_ASTMX